MILFTVVLRVAISKPRVARDGSELPSARLVSINIHFDVDVRDPILPHLHMVMGQLIDHDLSKTAISTIATNADGRFVSANTASAVNVGIGSEKCV